MSDNIISTDGIQSSITVPENASITFHCTDAPQEVMRWTKDGRIFWNGREVETDDELRAMVRDIHGWFSRNMA